MKRVCIFFYSTESINNNLLTNVFLVEFATVGKDRNGKVYHHIWKPAEIHELLKEQGLIKEEEED